MLERQAVFRDETGNYAFADGTPVISPGNRLAFVKVKPLPPITSGPDPHAAPPSKLSVLPALPNNPVTPEPKKTGITEPSPDQGEVLKATQV